jgi:hypothetical protein
MLGTLGLIDCVVVNRRFIHTSSLGGDLFQFFFEFDDFGGVELGFAPLRALYSVKFRTKLTLL